ncbi:MAG TPA: class I SAM-dependent methyltransferase [Mycobacteriales bacterium]|nr:class I SAM-dependent methyltransferase [Mycobacteriales bacterium]
MNEPEPYVHPTEQRQKDAWTRLLNDYLTIDPLEVGFARRLRAEHIDSFLELGGGRGPISELLDGISCVLLDLNVRDWDGHHRPAVIGDMRSIPVRPRSFDAVSAVNCLYFLADPVVAIRQAYEILKPGGIFLVSTPSRDHDPELAGIPSSHRGVRGPFDAEEAPELVAQVFDDIEVDRWEVAGYHLPDRAAVVDYLVAFGIPEPERHAADLPVPLDITKSGVDIWARRPG